jgi:alpha-L-glutamate ligase-like protein
MQRIPEPPFRHRARRAAWLLLTAGVALMAARVGLLNQDLRVVVPELHYYVEMTLQVEAEGGPVDLKMALPDSGERQTIRSESLSSGEMRTAVERRGENRFAHFSHPELNGAAEIGYTFSVRTEQVRYEIDPRLQIDPAAPPQVQRYLLPERLIQSGDPEIQAKLRQIVPPGERRVGAVLSALFELTSKGLAPLPLRGTTDAVTALELGEASCGGKSRLFVALARAAGIPSRVVGGLILSPGAKRSSHLWAEAWVRGHWVPYCPLNGYEATIPAHYLVLYRGDEPLFERSRDIRFRHFFKIKERLATPEEALAGLQRRPWNVLDVAATFRQAHISLELLKMILMLPFGALVVAFLRNIVGMPSFGTFMPALLALGFREAGLPWGLALLSSVLALAYAVRWLLAPLRLLQVPKLVVVLTTVIVWMLGLAVLGIHLGQPQIASVNLFPLVVLSMTAERFYNQLEERGSAYALTTMAYSYVAIAACYGLMGSFVLQSLVLAFPEMLLLPVALAVRIGGVASLRLSELFRFRHLLRAGRRDIVGMNRRNLDLIAAENRRDLFPLVNDKLKTKEKLLEHGIPHPRVLAAFRELAEVSRLGEALERFPEAALKPASGSGGGGILLLRGRSADGGWSTSRRVMSLAELERHTAEILLGAHALGGGLDSAFLEPLLTNHPALERFALTGVADLRVIVHRGEPVLAMLRLPTAASAGRANLHAGAVGVGVDLRTGKTTGGWLKSERIERHPDSGAPLAGFELPFFPEALELARRCHAAVPMGYMGVDIVLDAQDGPLVIELNGRPGLEIQNANASPLGKALHTEASP